MERIRRWGVRMGVALALTLVTMAPAAAFEISPLVHRLSPAGAQAEASLIVSNPSDQPLPVEFLVQHLRFDAEGRIAERIAADEDFVVFPPTALIPPGGKQRVRLQFAGEPELQASRSYFLTTAQVPVMLEADSSEGVEVVLALNALVHVLPQQPRPALSAELIELNHTSQGDIARIKLTNTGNTFVYLDDFTLEFRDGADRFRLTPADLARQGLSAFVPPGAEHGTEVVLPEGSWTEQLAISVF